MLIFRLPVARGPPKDELTVTAKGKEVFEQGLRHFESGQKKQYMALDEAAWPASAEFLAHSRIRKIDRAPVIWDHAASSRIWTPQRGLFCNIWRGQVYRAKRARQAGDRAQEAACLLIVSVWWAADFVYQYCMLYSRPHHCRATPTDCLPDLGKPEGSKTITPSSRPNCSPTCSTSFSRKGSSSQSDMPRNHCKGMRS